MARESFSFSDQKREVSSTSAEAPDSTLPQGVEESKRSWWKLPEKTKIFLRWITGGVVFLGFLIGLSLIFIPGIKEVAIPGMVSAVGGLTAVAVAMALIGALIYLIKESAKEFKKEPGLFIAFLIFLAITSVSLGTVFARPIAGFFGGTLVTFFTESLGFVAGGLTEALPLGLMIGLSVGVVASLVFWFTRATPSPASPELAEAASPQLAEAEAGASNHELPLGQNDLSPLARVSLANSRPNEQQDSTNRGNHDDSAAAAQQRGSTPAAVSSSTLNPLPAGPAQQSAFR